METVRQEAGVAQSWIDWSNLGLVSLRLSVSAFRALAIRDDDCFWASRPHPLDHALCVEDILEFLLVRRFTDHGFLVRGCTTSLLFDPQRGPRGLAISGTHAGNDRDALPRRPSPVLAFGWVVLLSDPRSRARSIGAMQCVRIPVMPSRGLVACALIREIGKRAPRSVLRRRLHQHR